MKPDKPIDKQDKPAWYELGEYYEDIFVDVWGEILGVKKNPGKKDKPWLPDLIKTSNGRLADVKAQVTPFFMAEKFGKCNPNFAVTFNHNDLMNYMEKYPTIVVYFWVKWDKNLCKQWWKYEVTPQNYVVEIELANLEKLCRKASLHDYKERVDDKRGNAKNSFVIPTTHPFFKCYYPDTRPTCNTCLHYWFKKLKWHCFLKDKPIKDLFTQRCSKYVDRFEKIL